MVKSISADKRALCGEAGEMDRGVKMMLLRPSTRRHERRSRQVAGLAARVSAPTCEGECRHLERE